MAYDFSKEHHEVLLDIEKSNGDHIHVTRITREGSDNCWIDFRIMYFPNGSDELRPTQKGVRIVTDHTLDVIKSILPTMTPDELSELYSALGEMVSEDSDDSEGSEEGENSGEGSGTEAE